MPPNDGSVLSGPDGAARANLAPYGLDDDIDVLPLSGLDDLIDQLETCSPRRGLA